LKGVITTSVMHSMKHGTNAVALSVCNLLSAHTACKVVAASQQLAILEAVQPATVVIVIVIAAACSAP
jgi:hypothetical protein